MKMQQQSWMLMDTAHVCTQTCAVGMAGSLTKLSVNGNFLKEIPESVGALTNLQELHLQANNLEHLPAHLCDLTVRHSTEAACFIHKNMPIMQLS